MGSEWIDAKLGDYIDSCLGKMLDKNKNKGEFYPYLGNSNVRWGAFDLDELAQMKFEDHEHVRYGIKAGDLIVCEGGEPGRCAIWEDDLPNMKIQKALHRVRTLDGLNSEFLYYWFLFAGKNKLLDAYFTGTTIKHLTGKALKEIPIKIPPLKHQKQVAVLLRGFDKKIKTNRQINQTLEQMAQTLFKSWFVDFDPVIDNALDAISSGKKVDIPEVFEARVERRKAVRESADFKPLPDDVRQLFPSEFEESELGWVPKGWGTCAVKSHCVRVQNGGTPKRSEASYWKNGNIPWLTSGEVRQSIVTEVSSVITQKGLEGSSAKWVEKQSTLVALYGATAGEVSINADKLTTNQAVCALMPQEFYCWFNYLQVKRKTSEMQSKAVGSAQQNISKGLVESLVVVSPTHATVKCFHDIAEGCFKRMIKNQHESRTLEKLRDTLLPKLISGELRLDSPEVEQAKALVE